MTAAIPASKSGNGERTETNAVADQMISHGFYRVAKPAMLLINNRSEDLVRGFGVEEA